MIFVQQPESLELAGPVVDPAQGAGADHLAILEHAQERPAILEITFLDIVHVFQLMDRFMIGDELLQRALTAKNDKGNAVDDPFGDPSIHPV